MDNTSFNLQVNHVKSDKVEKDDVFPFDDILSFRIIESSKDDSTFLKFTFKNDSTISYTFLGIGKIGSTDNVSDAIFECIRSYNQNKGPLEKIGLSPDLFATSLGRTLIGSLTVLLVFSIIWQLIKKPNSIPLTLFFGLMLYLIILGQRKKYIEMAKKLE